MRDDTFADLEAEEEIRRRESRRIHALEKRVAQLEAQVASLLSLGLQPAAEMRQWGPIRETNGSLAGSRQGER